MKKKENSSRMETKIKIAIVCGSMNIGGGETMAAKLAGYIDKKKFCVKYFVISKFIDNQIAKSLKDSGTEFECLNLPNSFSMESFKVFSEALKTFAPDVIHCHLDVSYSWVWAILNNKPLITTMHSNPFIRRDKRVAFVMRIKSIQGQLRVIGCSKKTMELVSECYHIPERQMGYIYNPISVSDYMHKESTGERVDFVAIGRLHEVKNYPMMIRALKKVSDVNKNVHLSIAGSGSLVDDLKGLTSDLKLTEMVSFLGNVEDIPGLLQNMDILLLSSISEACPMVILEAMASGLPVIATNVGGVPELVRDNGLLVDSNDVDGFADAMLSLINNKILMKNMSEKALEYSYKYDKSTITKEYEREYEKLAKRS